MRRGVPEKERGRWIRRKHESYPDGVVSKDRSVCPPAFTNGSPLAIRIYCSQWVPLNVDEGCGTNPERTDSCLLVFRLFEPEVVRGPRGHVSNYDEVSINPGSDPEEDSLPHLLPLPPWFSIGARHKSVGTHPHHTHEGNRRRRQGCLLEVLGLIVIETTICGSKRPNRP